MKKQHACKCGELKARRYYLCPKCWQKLGAERQQQLLAQSVGTSLRRLPQ